MLNAIYWFYIVVKKKSLEDDLGKNIIGYRRLS